MIVINAFRSIISFVMIAMKRQSISFLQLVITFQYKNDIILLNFLQYIRSYSFYEFFIFPPFFNSNCYLAVENMKKIMIG